MTQPTAETVEPVGRHAQSWTEERRSADSNPTPDAVEERRAKHLREETVPKKKGLLRRRR